MRSGITRQAIRRHRWSLLGTACTQAVAACVISMMIMMARSVAHLTGHARQAVEAADLPDATTAFLGGTIYISILIVGVTMNLAIAQQVRSLALLRAIGAGAGRLRRSIVLQAAIVAVPSSVLGFLAAIPLGYGWTALLRAHVGLPGVRFEPWSAALPIAAGIEIVTSVVGAFVAALRVTRIPPTAALTETSRGRPPVGRLRIGIGLLLFLAGAVLSTALSRLAPDQADTAALFVMLSGCVGVGLVGPVVLRAVAALLRPFIAVGLPRLALDNIATMSRALSGALVPLVLAAAFATVKVATHTTNAHVTGVPDSAADRWLDYSGTAIYCVFAAVAALNALITMLIGRARDLAVMRLAGATRGDVVRVVAVETAIVTGTGLVLSAWVASVTLLPMLHSSVHTWLPYIPAPTVIGGVVLVGLVVAAGMVAPAAVLARRPPIDVVRT